MRGAGLFAWPFCFVSVKFFDALPMKDLATSFFFGSP
jgi:hypothetical protein